MKLLAAVIATLALGASPARAQLEPIDRLLSFAAQEQAAAEAAPVMLPEALPPSLVQTGEAASLTGDDPAPALTTNVVLEPSSAPSEVPVVAARVARTSPASPNATRLVTPAYLVPAAAAGPADAAGDAAGRVEAADAAVSADAAADAPGATAKYLRERATPTDHLLQQAVAGIKRVEAADLGALSPGHDVDYEHRVKVHELEERARKAAAVPFPEGAPAEAAGEALARVGGVAEKLAHRVADLDKAAEKLAAKVFGASARPGTPGGEEREAAVQAREARLRRESEIASLVRDEVRVLTDEMHTELRMLKSGFFSEVRELLHTLRQQLRREFLRAEEAERKLAALAGGRVKSANVDLRDEVLLRPHQEKAAIDAAVSGTINRAYNKAHQVAQELMAQRNQALDDVTAGAAVHEELHLLEPKHSTLRQALERDAAAQRKADADQLERREDGLAAEATAAREAAEKAAALATKSPHHAAESEARREADVEAEAQREAGAKVDAADRVADERAAANAAAAESDAADILRLRQEAAQRAEGAEAAAEAEAEESSEESSSEEA